MNILRHIVGLAGIATTLVGVSMLVVTLLAGPPVEIDPTARIFTIEILSPHSEFFHIKDPAFHLNGGVTFKTSAGKEVIFGPSVQWVAFQE